MPPRPPPSLSPSGSPVSHVLSLSICHTEPQQRAMEPTHAEWRPSATAELRVKRLPSSHCVAGACLRRPVRVQPLSLHAAPAQPPRDDQ